MSTTWTIAVDWDRNGGFDGTYDDVTDDVMYARWFLGMRQPYQVDADDSMLELTLNNADKRYSPENTGGPLSGKLAPFRRVKVTSDDGTERTHWIGWVESIQPDVGKYGKRAVTIQAAGPMQFFKAAETNIALQENQRTDQVVGKLIEEVVVPPGLSDVWVLAMAGYSELGTGTEGSTILGSASAGTSYKDLDTGDVTLAIAADNWVHRDRQHDTFNVYRAISDMAAAERGRFFFDREGRARFWNRTRLQDEITSSLTLNDDMTGLRYAYAGIEADFKNDVIVVCHPRALSAVTDEVLWQLQGEVRIPAGDTRNVGVRYQDPDTGNARIGAKDAYVDGLTFSTGTAMVTLDAKANSATLVVKNDSAEEAILTAATVRGRRITDYGQMEAEARDGLSIANYGRRSLKMNLPSVDNLVYAQAIADYELDRRSTPQGTVKEVTLVSHGENGGDNHAHQLARTIGDLITISETQTAHASKKYIIIGEAHKLSEGGALYETTWYLEPATDSPYPWKMGATNRSDLGTSTRLAF